MSKDKDITPRNDKGESHGYHQKYITGDLFYKCYYLNGEEEGYEEFYDYDTNIKSKLFHLI